MLTTVDFVDEVLLFEQGSKGAGSRNGGGRDWTGGRLRKGGCPSGTNGVELGFRPNYQSRRRRDAVQREDRCSVKGRVEGEEVGGLKGGCVVVEYTVESSSSAISNYR